MSWNTGQPPTPSSESTAIEIRRAEGTVRSYVTVGSITAGTILKLNASGVLAVTGGEDNTAIIGVAFFTAASGQRVTVGKGQVRAFWDGAGTGTVGAEITASTTNSGWFTMGTAGSGATQFGIYNPLPGGITLAASNSGTLVPIMMW